MNFHERLSFEESPNDLLTIGELLVDMISNAYDDQSMSSGYTSYSGGSPANIAINAQKLGIRSRIAASVGEDGFGNFLLEKLRLEGAGTDLIQRAAKSTSLVVVTKSRATPVPIFYRGADCMLQYSPQLEQALQSSKIIHFSCWPLSMFPARQAIEQVILEVKARGKWIGFDPNYHPMLWRDGEDGVQYVKSILSIADVVKPSEDDAERLFGPDTPANQMEKFLKLGAKLVILTLGKDGALVSNGKETRGYKTMATDVVDTTGAGDAFWSGFYAGAVKGYTLEEALKLGFAVSAYKLKHVGAVVNLPRLEDIKEQFNL